jgi:hypothetical protein
MYLVADGIAESGGMVGSTNEESLKKWKFIRDYSNKSKKLLYSKTKKIKIKFKVNYFKF